MYYGSTAKDGDARSAQGSQKPAEHSQYIGPTNKLHQTSASVSKRKRILLGRHAEAVMKKRARGKYPEATAFACTSTLARPTNEPPGTAYVHVAYAWTRREESVENWEALQLSSLPRHQPLLSVFFHSPAFCHVLRPT